MCLNLFDCVILPHKLANHQFKSSNLQIYDLALDSRLMGCMLWTLVMSGEWWEMDLDELDRRMMDSFFDDNPSAATMNGKLGDLYNCSGN